MKYETPTIKDHGSIADHTYTFCIGVVGASAEDCDGIKEI